MESIITFTTTARRRNGWRGIGDADAAARDAGARTGAGTNDGGCVEIVSNVHENAGAVWVVRVRGVAGRV